MCAFQSIKSVDGGIARRDSHNDLMGTVDDFSLPQSYTYVAPPWKKYKEYSCALPTINIPKDMVWTVTEKSSKWGSHPEFLLAETFA